MVRITGIILFILLIQSCKKEEDKPAIPVLTTTNVTAITQTSALSGGNLTSDGGSEITVRGICWGMTSNPTISGSKTTDGFGLGSFTSSLTSLTPNAKYYVRAYATNSEVTAYGNQVTFTTSTLTIEKSLEILNEASIIVDSDIGKAFSEGAILDPGTIATEIELIDDVKSATVNPSGTSINIEQVDGNYTNVLVVVRDDERMFIETGKISNLSSSFNPTKYVIPNGDGKALILAPFPSINESLDDIASYLNSAGYTVDVFQNEEASLERFRGSFLDNYDVVYISTHGVSGARSHIRIDGEYSTVILTGEKVTQEKNSSLSADERKGIILDQHPLLKSCYFAISPTWIRETSDNIFHNSWIFVNACESASGEGNGSLSNAFLELGAVGFNGWPYPINTLIAGTVGTEMTNYFSSGLSFNDASEKIRNLSMLQPYNLRIPFKSLEVSYFINIQNNKITDQFYLIKPNNIIKPTISTATITSITETSAIAGGNIYNDGGASVTERGIFWGTSPSPESTGTKLQIGSGTGTYSTNLSGLTSSTTYYVKAYAINSAGTAFGNQVSFNTLVTGNSPVAAFIALPTTLSLGESVQFTDQSTNAPTNWSWDFGDGYTSTLQNPIHTYTISGIFSVSLQAGNIYGEDTKFKQDYITVTISPAEKFIINDGFRPYLSPNGNRIVFLRLHPSSIPGEDQSDIWSVNLDGTELTRLTNTPDECEYSPQWHPDGSKIAFIRSSSTNYDLYGFGKLMEMNSDGTNQTIILDSNWGVKDFSFYLRNNNPYIICIREDNKVWLSLGVWPNISTSGLGLRRESGKDIRSSYTQGLSEPDIVLSEFPGSAYCVVFNPVNLSEFTISDGIFPWPCLSPNGDRIAAGCNGGLPVGIYTMDKSGNNRVQITTNSDHQPAWSNNTLVFVRFNGSTFKDCSLYSIPIN